MVISDLIIDKNVLLSSVKMKKLQFFFPLHKTAFFAIIYIHKREMRRNLLFLAVISVFVPNLAHSACSRANLSRCLDSACAINLSSNPAARCQYCGTADAGTPPTKNAMKSVSVGAAAKYNISDKDLKKAPTDPGARYVWATTKCVEMVAGCTPDDVTNTYDKLIEQSCTAAGISAQMSVLKDNIKKTKTKTTCSSEISNCVIGDKRCGGDFGACETDADFNKFFSACAAEITGCDQYASDIRAELVASRDSAIKNSAAMIDGIAKSYQEARKTRENSAYALCTNNSGRDACISKICNERMPNNCGAGHADEKSMATQLCKYYDTACATIK